MERLLAHRNAFSVTGVERKGALTSPHGEGPNGGTADRLTHDCGWLSVNQ